MLGFETENKPITGIFAKRIRKQLAEINQEDIDKSIDKTEMQI